MSGYFMSSCNNLWIQLNFCLLCSQPGKNGYIMRCSCTIYKRNECTLHVSFQKWLIWLRCADSYVTNTCPSGWLDEQRRWQTKLKANEQTSLLPSWRESTLNEIDPLRGFIYYFKTETLNTCGYFVWTFYV